MCPSISLGDNMSDKRVQLETETVQKHPHRKAAAEQHKTRNVSANTNDITSSSGSTTDTSISHRTVQQRKEILRAENWKSKRTSQSKTNWISPGLKIPFRLLRAAEEFNGLRRKCNGNEKEAMEAYAQVVESSPHKASYFIVGGIPLFDDSDDDVIFDNSEDMDIQETTSHKADWERHNALLSKGWTLEHGSYSRGRKLLKVSPERKLQFISTREAENFEKARQECGGDEYKASTLFGKRAKEQGVEIAKVIVGGIMALFGLSTKNERREFLESKGYRRREFLKSKGWEIKRYRNDLLKLSPQRKLPFKSTKAAEDFESIRQSCNEDENRAVILFITRAKQEGRTIGDEVMGGLQALCPPETCEVENQVMADKSVNSSGEVDGEPSSNPTTFIHPIDGDFWEIDQVLQVRFKCQEMECLVQWKGFSSEEEWVPADNLCDTASK